MMMEAQLQKEKKVKPLFGREEFSPSEKEKIKALLQKKLPAEHVSVRPGYGAGGECHYVESWKAIELANSVFGFEGWACSIVDITPDFVEQTEKGNFKCAVTAVVKVSLKDGAFHEDVGFGCCENPHRGTAIENAKKEAISDARKRALRMFGNHLGNCLYDKEHIKKIKADQKLQKGPPMSQSNPNIALQNRPNGAPPVQPQFTPQQNSFQQPMNSQPPMKMNSQPNTQTPQYNTQTQNNNPYLNGNRPQNGYPQNGQFPPQQQPPFNTQFQGQNKPPNMQANTHQNQMPPSFQQPFKPQPPPVSSQHQYQQPQFQPPSQQSHQQAHQPPSLHSQQRQQPQHQQQTHFQLQQTPQMPPSNPSQNNSFFPQNGGFQSNAFSSMDDDAFDQELLLAESQLYSQQSQPLSYTPSLGKTPPPENEEYNKLTPPDKKRKPTIEVK